MTATDASGTHSGHRAAPADPAVRAHTAGRPGEARWVRAVGRVGIASRGVVYLLLGYLAFDIAIHGNSPAQTNGVGALRELEARSGGTLLLGILAAGLACYAAWRLFTSLIGPGGAVARLSSLVVGVIYAVLCVQAVELASGGSAKGGASSNPGPWVARVMRWPGGMVTIEVVGAVVIGAGLGLGAWGLFRRYQKKLAIERLGRRWQPLVKLLGGYGDLARGALVVLIGVYLVEAALESNASKAKGVDQTLLSLVHHPFGALAIGVISVGLVSCGIFGFFDARLRRL